LKEGQRRFNDKLDIILKNLNKINDDQCKHIAKMDEKFTKHADLMAAKIKKDYGRGDDKRKEYNRRCSTNRYLSFTIFLLLDI
jgi:hypothetical protein